jgi:hypothetical protein
VKRGRKVQSIAWLALFAMFALGSRATRGRARGGGRMLTLEQLRELARSAGFPDGAVDVAVAVAMAESRGDPHAVGDGGTSFGLWQVHTPSHPEFDASRLLDPQYNAHAAFLISRGGTDWHLWSTHNPGPHGEAPAYLQYMPGGSAA